MTILFSRLRIQENALKAEKGKNKENVARARGVIMRQNRERRDLLDKVGSLKREVDKLYKEAAELEKEYAHLEQQAARVQSEVHTLRQHAKNAKMLLQLTGNLDLLHKYLEL